MGDFIIGIILPSFILNKIGKMHFTYWQYFITFKNEVSGTKLPLLETQSLHHLQTMWPWATYMTSVHHLPYL